LGRPVDPDVTPTPTHSARNPRLALERCRRVRERQIERAGLACFRQRPDFGDTEQAGGSHNR
jgi:hypothetical protein